MPCRALPPPESVSSQFDVPDVMPNVWFAEVAFVVAAKICTMPPLLMIIEPRAELGRGIAYGTTDPGHLLNVRAGCLSALPDEPDHFTTWARRHTDADGTSFLPRAWYGEYLRSLLEPVEHIRAHAEDLKIVVRDQLAGRSIGH